MFLREACKLGKIDVVNYLLRKFPHIDISTNYNENTSTVIQQFDISFSFTGFGLNYNRQDLLTDFPGLSTKIIGELNAKPMNKSITDTLKNYEKNASTLESQGKTKFKDCKNTSKKDLFSINVNS